MIPRTSPYTIAGPEPSPKVSLAIGEVIFPLRYDVVARAGWLIDGYEPNRRLFGKDFIKFAEGQEGSVAWYSPRITHDYTLNVLRRPPIPEEKRTIVHQRYFLGGMRKLIGIYESLRKGWSGGQPSIGLLVPSGAKTSEGLPLPAHGFLADGQHRMISLWAHGFRELSPGMYMYYRAQGAYFPLDLTHCYIDAGLLSEYEFVEFARVRYPDHPASDLYELEQWSIEEEIVWLTAHINHYFGGGVG